MMRARSEVITFNRDDLEKVVRHMAQSQIAGSLFIGKFGDQTLRWMPDGGVEVMTSYVQGEFNDLPQAVENTPTPRAIASKRKGR
jgi:hypothetical protein